jgi:hypothetical protein
MSFIWATLPGSACRIRPVGGACGQRAGTARLWTQRQAAEVEPDEPLDDADPEVEDGRLAEPLLEELLPEEPLPEEPLLEEPLPEEPLPEEPLPEEPLPEEPLLEEVLPEEPDEAVSLLVDAVSPEELPPAGVDPRFAPLRESVR